ncbi:major facilitator superfamily domain-containing protein [Dichotomocladium elegans]|nr:major facilitator superfamily domain-containing protein [Dichotomocladium elegans]
MTLSFFFFCLRLWIGICLAALDSSIVATVYPQIGTEFKRANEMMWIATSYMLSYTALQPLYGRVSDMLGRKTAFLFAAIMFFTGSLFCGLATNLWNFVIARAIAGMGGGGLSTMNSVILSDFVSLRERAKYRGYANIAITVGSVLGAPVGGFITDVVGWRYCFFINLPLLLVTLHVGARVLTNYNLHDQPESLWVRAKKIDYLGAATLVLAVVSFLMATSLGGNIRPWSDPLVLGYLIASVAMTIIFCVLESKVVTHPLMPWHIMWARTPFACSLANFFGTMCSFGATYMTPIFFQGLLGYAPSHAGLFALSKVMAVTAGSLASGFYISWTGEFKYFLFAMGLMACGSMTLYGFWTEHTTLFLFLPTLMADGFSSGALVTSALIAKSSCVPRSEMATVTTISYLFRAMAGVIGVACSSAIFQGMVRSTLRRALTGPGAEEMIEIARKSVTDVHDLLPPEVLAVVLGAYHTALRYSFMFCLTGSIMALGAVFFIDQNDILEHN